MMVHDMYASLIGQRIERYRILRYLAPGAAGCVYIARDETTGSEVALKVTWLAPYDPSGMVERLDYEIAAIDRLRHPNIVTVYGYGQVEQIFYIAMELIRGGTFVGEINQHHPYRVYCRYGVQLALALQYMHDQGVIHRDVKPQNILVDPTTSPPRLVLTDFGIARVRGNMSVTVTGGMVGTPSYMAPEQARGDKKIDGGVDIYALGCVLYYALAGREPFVGEGPERLMYQHVNIKPPPLHLLKPTIPVELSAIIHQAMAKDRRERFISAKAFAIALQRFT